MAVILSHTTALRLWCSVHMQVIARRARDARTRDLRNYGSHLSWTHTDVTQKVSDARETKRRHEEERCLNSLALMTGWPADSLGPLHVLVPDGCGRHPTVHVRRHMLSAPVPNDAVIPIGAIFEASPTSSHAPEAGVAESGLYLSSPEFAYLQMAELLDMTGLVQLGMSLCGEYFPSDDSRGFINRRPVTSVDAIRSFLLPLQGRRNVRKALLALDLVIEGSRSPMETATAMLLTLPRIRGGYGLPRPRLNERLYLSEAVARSAGTPYYVIDLLYPEERVAIECLGRAYHKSPERDLTREYALKADGCHVVNVTIRQITNGFQRNQLVREIADGIGFRLRSATPRIRARRNELLNRIVPHPSSVGPDGTVIWEKPDWALPGPIAAAERTHAENYIQTAWL